MLVSRSAILTVATVALVVTGCRKQVELVTDPSRARVGSSEIRPVPLAEPERFPTRAEPRGKPDAQIAPQTLSQDLPVYPDSALDEQVVCTARLLYHIEVDGTASVVRLEWDQAPMAAHRAAFEASIRNAVATWEFIPGVKLEWKQREDLTYAYVKRDIPKARQVEIHFSIEDGKPVVR